MHLNQGELRAYLDRELDATQTARIEAHLQACELCQAQAEEMRQRVARLSASMSLLNSPHASASLPAATARARVAARLEEKEINIMLQKLFAPPYRTAWVALGVVIVLAVALAFPPVQAIANSFLGLFRVQQFTVVQVNPGNLPEQLGSASQLETMLTNDIQVEELGEPQTVASAAEASELAGIPVRLPARLADGAEITVMPGARVVFNVDMAHIRAVLAQIGQEDLLLPEELDGATVTVEIPNAVTTTFGDCKFSPDQMPADYDPDNPKIPRRSKCTALTQMISPQVNAPPGLDIAQIGQAFLQVMGMSPEDAAHFAENIDWATTLVIPIPRYGTSYQDVTIDGVTGTLIMQDLPDHTDQYMLLWVKDNIIYALTGPGNANAALRIAESLE